MDFSKQANEMIARAKSQGWDLSLDTIKALLDELDNPQDKIPSIHVTGTNGKGSICTFIDSICNKAGIKVGKYTSPAVENEFERYTINGKNISYNEYSSILEQLDEVCEKVVDKGFRYPSLFELETVLAFVFFYQNQCELMIIEVGMGGLLDATNVLAHPLICIFSNIDLEHTKWLGDSLAEIATNKAGIIKDGAIVISSKQDPVVTDVLFEVAKAHNCVFYSPEPLDATISLKLLGNVQYSNAAIASCAAEYLKEAGFCISSSDITCGLSDAFIPYRFETICSKPRIILDGAHNMAAIDVLADNIKKYCAGMKITFLVSVLSDKSFEKMFSKILPLAENTIVTESLSDRALEIDTLYESAKKYSQKIYTASGYENAADIAIKLDADVIIVFGTFTILSEIKKIFLERIDD